MSEIDKKSIIWAEGLKNYSAYHGSQPVTPSQKRTKEEQEKNLPFKFFFFLLAVVPCLFGNFIFLFMIGFYYLMLKIYAYFTFKPLSFKQIKYYDWDNDSNNPLRNDSDKFGHIYEKFINHLEGINETENTLDNFQLEVIWNANLVEWLKVLKDEYSKNANALKNITNKKEEKNKNKEVIKEVNQIKFGDGMKAYREEKLKGIDEQYKHGKNELTDEEREKMYKSVKDYKDGKL